MVRRRTNRDDEGGSTLCHIRVRRLVHAWASRHPQPHPRRQSSTLTQLKLPFISIFYAH